jgi:hypothetical protein
VALYRAAIVERDATADGLRAGSALIQRDSWRVRTLYETPKMTLP